MKSTTGYSGIQIALHWVMAILVILAWLSGGGAEEALETVETGGTSGFVPHVAFGLAVLALVVLRIAVRIRRGAPPAPGTPGSLQVRAADWAHRLLYLLMLAVPLGGISAWFLRLDTGEVHALFANLLLAIALGHALMALYHQYVLKDGLIRRMMRRQ